MSLLTLREQELVALGAAMGSNCISCIEFHVPTAKSAGLTDAQIAQAVWLADKIRQVPARKTLSAALSVLSKSVPASETAKPCCA